MSKRNSIVEIISDPTKGFLASFLIGTVLFTIISDGFSALFWENFGSLIQSKLKIHDQTYFRIVALVTLSALVVIVIYITPFSRWLKKRLENLFRLNNPEKIQTSVKKIEEKFPGLITAMGRPIPNKELAAKQAILFHWNNGNNNYVNHCWLLCTNDTLDAARSLEKELVDLNMSQKVKLHYGDNYKIKDTEDFGEEISLLVPDESINDFRYVKKLVNCIYADANSKHNLSEGKIISDCTGSTKPVTIGMVLACINPSRRLQYISQLNNEILEIKISYKLKPEKEN